MASHSDEYRSILRREILKWTLGPIAVALLPVALGGGAALAIRRWMPERYAQIRERLRRNRDDPERQPCKNDKARIAAAMLIALAAMAILKF